VLVFLNNAATSFPKAPGMGEEVAAFIEEVPRHPGRSGAPKEDVLFLSRAQIAHLINAEDSFQIVLCKNSTEALNIAIHGIGLKNDVVVTTAMEHNSVLRPLYYLERKGFIQIEIVPCDSEGRVIEEQWIAKINQFSPRLVVLNHVSNVTGAVNNAETLLHYAKAKGSLTILDASQSIGLLDIDVSRIEADIVAFTGHKYLLGPSGTGGMYVRKGIDIEPVFVGGTGVRSDLKEMPSEMPQKLEPGTSSIPLFAGLLYSLRWQKENLCFPNQMNMLIKQLELGLADKGAEILKIGGERTSIVSFQLPGWDLEEVGYILDRSFGIICRTGLHCAPLIHTYIGTAPEGTIRFSLSRFTSEKEIDYTLDCIGKLMNGTH
jgi:selenocysteine lyase/cysteine desulfurase